ncbi:MAG: hypothetical protein KC417_01270, partial [Myxococcales bacterium]|nr:hypothetical protein [Myxococcales bacterium]
MFRELRVVVAMSDEQLAERLVKSLERAGALVVLTHPGGDRLRHAASIDPQLVYVDADGLGSKGMRLGRALQSNPRLRWASVLRFSSHQLSSNDPRDPTLVRLAVESKPRIQIDSLLTERARRDPPFVVQMARIGPNRLLRALEPIDGALRVTVLGPRAVAQIDLENGRLIGASWKEVTPDRVSIEGLDAVATFLTLEHGDVRIERRERTTLSNVNERLSSALALAAARIPTGTEITERPTLEDEIPDLLELELLDHGKRDSETQRTGPPGEPPWLHLGFNFGEEVFGDLVHDTIVSAPPSSLSRTNTEAADEAVTRHVAESEVRSFLEAAEGFDAHADTDAGDTSPDETANATRIAGNPTALLGPRERTGPRPLFQDAGFDHDADDDALTLVREPSERHGLQGHDAEESPHFELDRPV